LIISHGAPAALDRVHTVFHGYLKAAFEKVKLPMPNDRPGIIELLGLLRKHGIVSFEPELETLVNQTFRGVQKAVDALETFRNEHSLAHPQTMLPEAEALFVINVTQAMLRYLDARLQ
jgi:Abortive infection C-terminus